MSLLRRPVLGPPRIVCRQCQIQIPLHRLNSTNSPSQPPPALPSTGRLPSASRNPQSLSERTAEYLDTLQLRALSAGQKLNDVTGYSTIESLKQQISQQEGLELISEDIVRKARAHLQECKEEYTSSVRLRSSTQRELTELLNRKVSWTPDDLARFTRLYPSDHENEARVQRAQEALSKAERESEEASSELGRLILTRYHEEQIWSDKIRRASTWGTFALMGVNLVLFVVVQVGLEPWRRKRLVRGFEEKVKEVVQQAQPGQSTGEGLSRRSGDGSLATEHEGLETTAGDTIGIGQHDTKDNTEDIGAALSEDWIVVDSEEIPVAEEKQGILHEKKDMLVGAAGGVVIGSFVTALGTYLLSR